MGNFRFKIKKYAFLLKQKPFGAAFVNMLYYKNFHKLSSNDYIKFNFANLSSKLKKTYVTMSEYNRLLDSCINDMEGRIYLRDKGFLLRRLPSKMLNRQYLDLRVCKFEDFWEFISHHKRFVVKCYNLASGNKIFVIDNENNEQLQPLTTDKARTLYEYYVKNELYIIEEYIKQHKNWSRVNPDCVNTIRVHTFKTSADNYITCWHWMPRFGVKGSATDMGESYFMLADPDTGNIITDAYKDPDISSKNPFVFTAKAHKDTEVIFNGLHIPYHDKITPMVEEAASYFPEQKLIGWDIALMENGPVIVEGNACPQAFNTIQYLYSTISGGSGYKKQLEDILSYLE